MNGVKAPHQALYYLVTGNVLAESDPRLRSPDLAILAVCRDGEGEGWRPMRAGEEPARVAKRKGEAGSGLAGMEGPR